MWGSRASCTGEASCGQVNALQKRVHYELAHVAYDVLFFFASSTLKMLTTCKSIRCWSTAAAHQRVWQIVQFNCGAWGQTKFLHCNKMLYRGMLRVGHDIDNIVLVWQCAGAASCWSSIVQQSRGP